MKYMFLREADGRTDILINRKSHRVASLIVKRAVRKMCAVLISPATFFNA